MSIRMPFLHNKLYVFSHRRRWIRHAHGHCLLGPSILWLPETNHKRWSIVVRLTLPPHCSVDSVPFWSKSTTVLHLPFSPFLCMECLLEQLDDNLKGSLGLFQVLILVLLWNLTFFSGKYSCSHISLYIARRESNPSGGRRFNIQLWIVSGPGIEFLMA